ncbi:Ribosomal L28 family, putative [Theobroma cacao]|uniref:Large ribosomal subunit protein bL28m n=1 Tax=Theobroma cacao TaxID=3641 RepID=A0A061GHA8_THECC|nr:Ribosomal L28 family, putative [Theobroma cacao]
MAFRGKEMMKKLVKKVGENNLAPGVKEQLKKCIPDSKVVMNRAKRGLYAGRHIQFGNRISEDGGNKYFFLFHSITPCFCPEGICGVVFRRQYWPWLSKNGENDSCSQPLVLGIKALVQSRRSWKPNVQDKRLFSYILDRHIRVKVTTHALRCIDKAGGIDEYLLKTPYQKMDTEMGLFWKAKIEKMYEELGQMEVVFFSPEEEAKFEQGFKDLKLAERAARRDARRQMYGWTGKQEKIEDGKTSQVTDDETASIGEDS